MRNKSVTHLALVFAQLNLEEEDFDSEEDFLKQKAKLDELEEIARETPYDLDGIIQMIPRIEDLFIIYSGLNDGGDNRIEVVFNSDQSAVEFNRAFSVRRET